MIVDSRFYRVIFIEIGSTGAELAWLFWCGSFGCRGIGEILEAHFFDFNGDLYGQQIEVILKKKIRPERRFEGLAQLQQQIALDAQQARDYFALPPA